MNTRFATIALLITLVLVTGCVRHTTVQDFGLKSRPAGRSSSSPDASLRAVFQKQTQGAFNPLSDDARIQSLKNRLKINPADYDARLDLAVAYENYRLYDQALEHYTEAFSARRSEKAILGIVRCDQAMNRAWQAIPLLEQFLKETPSGLTWNTLGLLHGASRDLRAAESAFRQAVAADPSSDQWHSNLGYNLLLQNKTDAAETEFRKALDLNPKSVTAHNNLGVLLARREDLPGALAEFQFGADAATAHNNLAVVLLEMGKYEQSREQLVKALNIRRYFAPALSNFKLVQERIHQRAELQKAARLPQSNVRVAAAEPAASEIQESKD